MFLKKISVIIPTYNSINTLKKCINSINDQSYQNIEIIVVDNGSTDNTSIIIKKNYPKVKLITLKENMGVTGGRNAGIKLSDDSSEYILFFDHDMIADKHMLQNMLETLNKNVNIGLVTPKIFYLSDKNRIWSAGTKINLWTGNIIFRGGVDVGQYDIDVEVQVTPACILVKKEVINKIGTFDDTYFAVYEDTDFCLRAIKAGFKIYYSSKALAYHDLSTKKEDEYDRLLSRSYWIGRNRVLFMKKYSHSFIIFTLFVPLYCYYYFKMALTNNRLKDGKRFIKGTIDGYYGRYF